MSQGTILIIEDDPEMIELISTQASEVGCTIEAVTDGKDGLERALRENYSLVIVDLNLPRMGGLEILKKLRQEREALPILILTSRAEEIDKVLGLELGADDYMTKPFGMRELVARINAMLRRAKVRGTKGSVVRAGDKLIFGPLVIDSEARTVTLDGKLVALNATEFDLLKFLSDHHGQTFSREDLVQKVWNYQASQFEPTVTMYLSRLRSKIEPRPEDPRFIHTVRGAGYCFEDRGE